MLLSRVTKEYQRRGDTSYASFCMVMMHTFRSLSALELVPLGKEMCKELERGFPHIQEGQDSFELGSYLTRQRFPDGVNMLAYLHENNFISQNQLEKLKKSEVKLKKRKIKLFNEANSYSEEVRRRIKEKYGFKQLYSEGLAIKIPLDVNYELS